MAIHDQYARFTPYELSIPGREFAEEHFTEIADEGESRGADLSDPDAFVMLAATGAALREIRGEEDDPALIEQYGALLFHGFHFWRSGETFYLLDLGVARYLVESEPDTEGWAPVIASAGGYVQLPRHLFWAHAEDDSPAEPLDGFFWTRTPGDSVEIMAAMGMREDRPGLSVISLPPLPLDEVATWTTEQVREVDDTTAGAGGDDADSHAEASPKDFASLLPGAEYDRLYSVVAAGEIVKLAGLVLWYLEQFSDDIGLKEGGRAKSSDEEADPPPDPEGPLPSALPYRRIRLGGGT